MASPSRTRPAGAPGAPAGAVVACWARAGLWLLPVHALLLALSTLTHQPDPRSDFDAYAQYVTTGSFLASHLGASVLGAGLGLVGAVAALAFLARGPAPRSAMAGAALTVVGTVVTTSVFGAAAFAQPAVGRSHLAGAADAAAVDADVYGAPLVATAVTGLLLLVAGAVLLGRSVARTHPALRWAGAGYAACLAVFVVAGFTVQVAQPVAALALAGATVVVARRLPAVAADGLDAARSS